MKKGFVRVLVISTLIAMLMVFGMESVNAQEMESGRETVVQMATAIQTQEWDKFISLMISSEQSYYIWYFNDTSNTNGIKQIESAEMVDLYEVNISDIQDELLTEEYPILQESTCLKAYILALDCCVNKENQYFFNGVNYFLVILAEESEEFRVVQFNRPSLKILEKTVDNEEGFAEAISDNEKAGIHVIEMAENGIVINANNEIIEDEFTIVDSFDNSEESVNPLADGTTNFPNLKAYTNYSYPSKIRVKLNKTGNGTVKSVNFDTYIKNTLPNEWYASWNKEALMAGAYCVKMAGWYRTIKPVNNAGGYDVTQSTQYYVPNTSVKATNDAVESIAGCGMADSTNKLFFPEYAAGTEGSAGTQSGGQLKQWGSQYLASKKGYNCGQILNYYYKGSAYSSGYLAFFEY